MQSAEGWGGEKKRLRYKGESFNIPAVEKGGETGDSIAHIHMLPNKSGPFAGTKMGKK